MKFSKSNAPCLIMSPGPMTAEKSQHPPNKSRSQFKDKKRKMSYKRVSGKITAIRAATGSTASDTQPR